MRHLFYVRGQIYEADTRDGLETWVRRSLWASFGLDIGLTFFFYFFFFLFSCFLSPNVQDVQNSGIDLTKGYVMLVRWKPARLCEPEVRMPLLA